MTARERKRATESARKVRKSAQKTLAMYTLYFFSMLYVQHHATQRKEMPQMQSSIPVLISNRNTSLTPPTRAFPGPNPKRTSNPNTNSHSPESRRIAVLPIAHNILLGIQPRAERSSLRSHLINMRIHDAPECSSSCRNHGYDSPIRAEILNAPDDGDHEGC